MNFWGTYRENISKIFFHLRSSKGTFDQIRIDRTFVLRISCIYVHEK